MKRYLLLGVVVLWVNAHASLKEDFFKMDQAEDNMLSSMRTSVVFNDGLNEDKETTKGKRDTKNTGKVLISPTAPDTNKLDSIVNEKTSKKKHADELAIKKEKALKIKIDSKEAAIKKLKKAEEIAALKQLRVLEAYEKERAEKLAKEAVIKAAKKKKQEKKKLAAKELEKVKIKENSTNKAPVQEAKKAITAVADVNIKPVKKPEVEKKILVKKVPNKSIIKENKTKKALDEEIEVVSDLYDVNILRELEEKTKLANKAYEDAIKEMQEED
ncbi:MAG: hypothetical protein Q9M39_00670 [Sulfurovum sp.]|nr:hypothetical protein [Sulfurovum sp.]